MFIQTNLDRLFPPASAKEVLCLLEEIHQEEPEERSIVDETGTRNVISRFSRQSAGKATHDNLLGIVEVPPHLKSTSPKKGNA